MKRWVAILCFAVALFCLVYPLYVIRPFRHQGAGELAFALHILAWRWPVVIACSLISIALLSKRIPMIVLTVLTLICAALTRVNIYEQMFHPLGAPAFAAIAQTKLAANEKVIAVSLNNTARAYPVRAIAYHHIVNDTLDGVPIVATY